ncbi:ROK family protein [Nanchangia anserum]|uniref:ROK family protein n=1 Tax=Nanchangia anserum TaxID=2692125 RepID=A0A8I0GCZ9_9ACTO|nr:ROK family protein [Nanchangia anserum]MBD3689726.1 ROK family protein [Nanchangia anserum]QOX81897.1 ROK family protein [Nanchangia anserum]
MTSYAIGIDIGGSGVKGALVNAHTGTLESDVHTVATPYPATPQAVLDACARVVELIGGPEDAPIGISFPAPIVHGRIPFMANLDQEWVGITITDLVSERLNRHTVVVNDGDAAAIGEYTFGAAADVDGVVVVTTLGTGIGSGIVVNGTLVPNTELGHLEIDGNEAEKRASAKVKTDENLDWEQYTQRLQRYYEHVEMLFSPDLFVIGGGISENADKFIPNLKLRTPVRCAGLRNTAGIVGAAAAVLA